MTSLAEQAMTVVRAAGERLEPGLDDGEVSRVESEFGIRFVPEHREFLQLALPVGDGWPDWRSGDRTALASSLAWPTEGVLFDVEQHAFWSRSWGARPADDGMALTVARRRLAGVPRLVPLFGHRYLPAAPHPGPAPVLSVHQSDVIYYGADLADHAAHEFGTTTASGRPRVRVAFWSDLAEGLDP